MIEDFLLEWFVNHGGNIVSSFCAGFVAGAWSTLRMIKKSFKKEEGVAQTIFKTSEDERRG